MTALAHLEEQRFRTFLNANYAKNTARKYLSDVRSYLEDPSVATRADIPNSRKRDYVYAWKALEFYVARTGAPMPPMAGPEMPPVMRGGRKLRESQQRRKIKKRFNRDEWATLWAALDSTKPTDVVLRLQMQTALRAGDVLRVERDALGPALRDDSAFVFAVKGGKESSMPIALGRSEWVIAYNGMKSTGAHNIAGWVSVGHDDPSGAAYFKTLKRFKQLGEELKLTEPFTTHRIRRSLATFLLEEGASDTQIQQILDHEKVATSQHYTQGGFATVRGQLLSDIHTRLTQKK